MAPIISRIASAAGNNFGFGRRRGGSVRSRQIVFTMWGGGGGGWIRKSDPAWGPPSIAGGTGGALIATTTLSNLGLTSGSQLYIYVGGGGAMVPGVGGPNGGHPGGGGSGSGGYGGGGGGMSSIYMNGPFSTGTLLLIAGGGSGGNGLVYTSGLVSDAPPSATGNIAKGGNQSTGGAGGPGVSGGAPGSPGSQFTGGAAGTHGGGGGAGYYGGGGGPGDAGAANGSLGGAGSCYLNGTYFTNDTSDSGLSNGVVIANIFRRFPAPFNPPMPFSNPTATYPYESLVYPGPYYQPASSTASSPFPGQNAGHPLYNANYGGGTLSGGAGYPGSIFITIDGTTFSYTTAGPYVLTIP